MQRAVIHINVADFAVAVERAVDLRLSGRPVIIAPDAAARSLVYDMSEEAYQAGVRKGMPLETARRHIRDAVVLPPRTNRYERAMTDLFRAALPYTPLVETGPDDGHLFLDVTGTSRLYGPAVDVAARLYREIRSATGLHPIWSVAPNKLTAKVGTRLVKPEGEYIVKAGDEAAFLSPLPIRLLPGLEPGDLDRLFELSLTRVHQAATLTSDQLEILFERRAPFFFDTFRGNDASPVFSADRRPPSIAADREFGEDRNDPDILAAALYRLCETVGAALRGNRRFARTLAVTIDHTDGKRRIRQSAVKPPSATDAALFAAAKNAFFLAWTRRVRVRHMRLLCAKTVFPPAQEALFAVDREQARRQERLNLAVDRIRERFGHAAVQSGRFLAA